MTSEGAGRAKSKRYNDHGKPYERRRSIIGIVADTMKGIFKSSWVSQDETMNKASPSSEEENGRQEHNNVQHKHGQNSNHGLDSNLGQSYIQPASTSIPGPSKQVPVGLPQIPVQAMTRPEHGNFTSDHLPFMQYQSKPASLIVNGADDRSELSECSISTGTCSTQPQHQDKDMVYHRDMVRHQDSRIHQMRQELGGSITPSKELEAQSAQSIGIKDVKKHNERSFLWSGQSPSSNISLSRPQASAKRKPSFNVSIFGSSISQADKSGSHGNGHNDSLFYPGKTTFGGASAQKKRKLQETSPPQLTPNKRQVRAKPLASSTSAISSSSARRILSTLERMSSPLNDAKKIPSYNSSLVDSPLSFTPSAFGSAARKKNVNFRGGSTSVLKGPPVHTLSTPGTVQIAKNFHTSPYLNTTSHDVALKTTVANSSPCAMTTPTTVSYSDPGSSSTRPGKMKHSRGQHYSSKKEDDVVEVPKLRTDFTLPVSSMPKFDFKATATNLPPSSKTSPSSSEPFTFSTPIHKSQPCNPPGMVVGQNFQFSSPINVEITTTRKVSASEQGYITKEAMNRGDVGIKSGLPKPDLGFAFNPAMAKRKSLDNDQAGQLIRGSAATSVSSPCSADGSVTAATELKSGSVMDVLGGSKKPEPEKNVNKTTDPATAVSTNTTTTSSLSDLFKKPSGSWECPTCMIQNKVDVTSCPACLTPKPGAVDSQPPKPAPQKSPPSYSAPDIPVENSLAAQFKKPEGSWECDTCMVMNNVAATKCIACETSKPGIKKATSFTSAGGFKIGPTGGFQLDNSTKDTTSATKPSGGFQIDKLTSKVEKTDNKPVTGGFKFGTSLGPDSKTNESSGGFKFGASLGSDSKANGSNGGFKIPDITQKSEGGFKFGSSLATSSPQTSTASESITNFKSGDNIINTSGSKKDNISLSVKSEKEETAAPVPTVGGFSFGQTVTNSNNKITDNTKAGGFAFGAPASAKVETSKEPISVLNQGSAGLGSGGSSKAVIATQDETKPNFNFSAGQCSVTPSSSTTSIVASAFSFGASNSSSIKTDLTNAPTEKKEIQAPTAASASTFTFGQLPKEQTNTGFALGTNPKTESSVPENKPAFGGFNFSKPPETAPSQAASLQAASSGIFGFGAAVKTADSSNQQAVKPLIFDAKSTQPTPATSSGPGATATGGQQSSLFQFGATTSTVSTTSAASMPTFNFSARATTSTTASGVVFPSTKPTETAATGSNMFSFTGKTASTSSSGTTPTFAFGQQNTQTTTTAPTFGVASTTSASFGGFTKSASSPAFGALTKTSTANMFGNSTNLATPSFGSSNVPSFGSSAANTNNPTPFGNSGAPGFGTASSTGPAFGVAVTTSAPAFGTASSTPAFGSSTAPAFGTATTSTPVFGATSTTTAPAFGASTGSTSTFGSTTNNTGFGFGAQQQNQSSSGVFQFGQNNQPSQQTTGFNFGQAAQSSTTSGFNFNAPNATSPPANNFAFNAPQGTATPTANPFSVTPTPSSTGRRLKKAVRKIRK